MWRPLSYSVLLKGVDEMTLRQKIESLLGQETHARRVFDSLNRPQVALKPKDNKPFDMESFDGIRTLLSSYGIAHSLHPTGVVVPIEYLNGEKTLEGER